MYRFGLAILLSGIVTACTTTDSSIVDTDGMWAEFSVEADAGTSEVTALLHIDGATSLNYADVGNGDELRCAMSLNGTVLSTKDMTGGAFGYDASFDAVAADTTFTIEFDRSGSGQESALESTVSLPVPFTLDPLSSSYSRAGDLDITWTSATNADPTSYLLTGSCIQQESGSLGNPDDVGVAWGTGNGETLIRAAAQQETETCTVTVTITRTRSGTVDSAFDGGTFVANQVRTTTFTSIP